LTLENHGKKQPVKMSIHSLLVFSEPVDIEIAARNHRMPCWSHCRNK